MSVLKNPNPYKRTGSAWSGPKRVSGQSELEKIYGVPSSHGVQKAGGGNAGTTMNAGNQQLMDAYGAGNPVIAGGGTSGTQTSTTPTVGSSKAPTPTTAGGTTVNTGNQQLIEAYGREETPSAAKTAYDTGMTELQRTYGAGVKKQEQIRSDSRREASIAYDRMSKYLPRAQMAMGTAGTGMAESDRIAAYNHYTGQLADANRVYADNVADLDEARAAGETELQRVYAEQKETERKEKDTQTLDVYKGLMDDALASGGRLTQAEYDAIVEKGKSMGLSDGAIESMVLLNEMYGGKITPDGVLTEEEFADNSLNLYDEFLDQSGLMTASGKLSQSDYDSLQAWYKEHEGELSESHKRSIGRQLDYLKGYVHTDEEQAKADVQTQIEKDGGAVRAGVSFYSNVVGSDQQSYVQFSDPFGNIYTIPQMEKCEDKDIVKLAGSIAEVDEVFLYENELYVRRSNGTYKLGSKRKSTLLKGEEINYNQLVAYFNQYANGKISLPRLDPQTAKSGLGTDAARTEKFK